ncbi:MAG: glycine zipper family protein [Betaproteobacteria bacterium]|nr:glycine zipper family protein [Betaproteobacteria bacterium]
MSPRSLQRPQRPIAAALALVFLATSSGCATNPDGSFKKDADGSYVMDDKAKGALIGAAAGCALGSATGAGCAKGAMVGAIAGVLIGWYFESKKIASAAEVNKQYAAAATAKKVPPPKKGAAPTPSGKEVAPTPTGKDVARVVPPKNDVVPASFSTQVKESPPDASGQKEVQLTSNTDMIGYGDKVPEVQQKYAIYDENNKLLEEKTEKVAAVDGAGRYQSTSKFKLPADAKGKNYTVKTSLVSDNKTYKESSYKVALADDGGLTVLAMAH